MSLDRNSTKHTRESIQAGFILGFKGVFTISDFVKHPLKPKSFQIAFASWLIFSTTVLGLQVSLYDLIIDMVNNLIIWIPCILGFTIGGYGFLIGFIQANLMQKISEPRPKSHFSLFQLASAAFACNIILQAIALVIAFIIHYIIYIDTKKTVHWSMPRWSITGINTFAFLLVGLSFAISLAVVVQLVINVFNFSQLHHYNTNKEKLDEKEKDDRQSI